MHAFQVKTDFFSDEHSEIHAFLPPGTSQEGMGGNLEPPLGRPLAIPQPVDYRRNQAVEAKTRYLKRWGLETPPLIPGDTPSFSIMMENYRPTSAKLVKSSSGDHFFRTIRLNIDQNKSWKKTYLKKFDAQ